MASLPLIYLCRHGQTDWNAANRLQGQSDIPLNDFGREQARGNGRRLREMLGNDASELRFISSPMIRAVETMRLIRTEMGLAPDAFERDDRLREIHFGDWQGYTTADLKRIDPVMLKRRNADKWNFLPPGENAETYESLACRVAPVFEALDAPALVVAHGGITRAFLQRFAGMSSEDASHVDIPQDRVLRFEDGRADWV